MYYRKMMTMVALAILLIATGSQTAPLAAAQTPPPQSGSVKASMGYTPAPTRVHVTMSSEVPQLTEAQKRLLKEREQRGPLPAEVPLPLGTTAVNRPDSTVDPDTATYPQPSEANAPEAPGTFTLFRNNSLGAIIKSQTSGATGEPTVVNSGAVVFATGNWWGAISTDGGITFNYINPYTAFPASFGGLCCDQVAVYDPARDLILWYLQYTASGPAGSGQNLFRLAASTPSQAAQGNWWWYDFTSATNTEWDFPDMCVSNDYVWVSTNRGVYNSGMVNDAWLFKFPLDPIMTGSGFSYGSFDLATKSLTNIGLRCTRGATDIMRWGSHNTTSQVRIFNWAENGDSVGWNDVNLSAAWYDTTHVCPTPDGQNWCEFSDGRILAGWVGRGKIGFMWNSAAGGSFSQPYIDAVRVNEADLSYLNRPFVWSSTLGFQYPSAAPNIRGDVGITLYWSSATVNPTFAVGIDDDYSRAAGFGPPNWEMLNVRTGTQGPTANRWGDYFSVQPFRPSGLGWITAGTTLEGCGDAGCKETRYVIFGRERDLRSVQKYYNPLPTVYLPATFKN